MAGKTILLFCEQGHGDAIQFVRYAPLLADRGAKVLLECPTALSRLFSGVKGVDRLIETGEAVISHEFHCSLMSLQRFLKTTPQTIPATVPYLRANPALMEAWGTRLVGREIRNPNVEIRNKSEIQRGNDQIEDARFEHSDFKYSNLFRISNFECRASRPTRVGVSWSGNSRYYRDRDRSLRSGFARIAVGGDYHFISLQKKSNGARMPPVSGPMFTDLTDELKDWADTAGLIENLDLVISSDTAVAHLAGALGKPVWLLTSVVPDWRWLLDRNDSPWYPTMRLFRQPRARDWQSVIIQVVEKLKAFETTRPV